MALTANTKVWKIIIGIFLVMTIVFWLLFYFRLVFITFVVGLSLIVLTEELTSDYRRRAERRKLPQWKRKLYAIVVILFWVSTIVFLFGMSINGLSNALIEVREANVTFSEIATAKIEPFLPDFITQVVNEDNVTDIERYVLTTLSGFVTQISSFLLAAMLIIPLMFFMYFRRRDELIKTISEMVPGKFSGSFHRASRDIGRQMHEFLKGKVLQSSILATMYCIGFFVAGVKGWLIFGVLAGFLNIVPYIGPVLGAIPPMIVTLLVDAPIALVYVLVVIVIVQAVDNFYLQPFMLSGKVRIDPLVSIVLILIGAQLYGGLGMIFAIPIFIVYKIVLKEAYQELVRIYED